MIAFEWSAEILGEAALVEGIAELEYAFSSFKIPLQKSADIAGRSIGENIVRNLDNFAPLSPSTLYQTAAYRLGGPLYRRGDMMEAASDTTGTVEGSGFLLTDDTAQVGLDIDTPMGKIGDYLTRGNTVNNLPPRPFVRVLNSDVDLMTEAFAEYVELSIVRAFG